MSKRGYILLIIIIVGIVVVAAVINTQPKKRTNQLPPEFKPQGTLITSFNIYGVGEKGFYVNKTWKYMEVWISYDASKVRPNSSVALYDSKGNLQQRFNIQYLNKPGTKITESAGFTLYGPPLIEGPYGEWKVVYNLPKNADFKVSIYATFLNSTK